MYTIIIFIILTLLTGLFLSIKNRDSGMALMVSVFVVMFGSLMLAMILTTAFPTKDALAERYELRAAENSSDVEGRFFLGSGHISEYNKVGYFYEIAPQQYKHNEVYLDDKVIIATDLESGQTPYVEFYSAVFTEDWMRQWGVEEPKTSKIIFHVHEESISNYLVFTP